LCSQHDELGQSFGGLNVKRSSSGDAHKLSSERVLPLRYNFARDTAGLWVCAGLVERISTKAGDLVHKGVSSAIRVHESLTKTQRLWIQYRDANCSAERDLYEGGTAKYAVYFACLESLTRERTRELQITYAVRLK
jgi:Lysozyme inhibitor LprI